MHCITVTEMGVFPVGWNFRNEMSCQEMEIDTKVWWKELLIKQFLYLSMKVGCGNMVRDAFEAG